MVGLSDAAGSDSRLEVVGDAEVGVELTGDERQASLARGGDGRVAVFDGGYLSAGQGAEGELNLTGVEMTILVRLRDPSGEWGCPLFSKHGDHDRLVYNLFAHDFSDGVMRLGFEMGTTENDTLLRVTVPLDDAGCLVHLTSTDLRHWGVQDPFYVPGLPGEPEWPDHFRWNDSYYLVFSNGGLARYRMSRSPLGPWEVPPVDVFGSPYERVVKTAAGRTLVARVIWAEPNK